MSLDTQPHHPDTVAAWHRMYGHDDEDGTVVHWAQHGWHWSAIRRDGLWWIDLGPNPTSRSSARGHMWDELCSRLSRMSARDVTHEVAGSTAPPSRMTAPPARPRRPLIPFDRFPDIGGI